MRRDKERPGPRETGPGPQTSSTRTGAASTIPRLEVDGPRPAVMWVSLIPPGCRLSVRQRLVLWALAVSPDPAPPAEHIASWTGTEPEYVRRTMARLERPTLYRPALVAGGAFVLRAGALP